MRRELIASRRWIEEGRAIDLGNLPHISRTRRPFDLECVAAQCARIAGALERPGKHALAALLHNFTQRDVALCGIIKTGFLAKFAAGRGEQILVEISETWETGKTYLSLS